MEQRLPRNLLWGLTLWTKWMNFSSQRDGSTSLDTVILASRLLYPVGNFIALIFLMISVVLVHSLIMKIRRRNNGLDNMLRDTNMCLRIKVGLKPAEFTP